MEELANFCFIVICVFLRLTLTAADDLPTCQPHDFHYEYTECDSQGGRWRVSVPEPDKCTGGAPNPPIRGKGCDFTCDAGQYLDIQNDQECHPCPPGTYSLGGGVRFADWDEMPSGFATEVNSFSGPDYMAGFGFSRGAFKTEKENCTGAGWVASSRYASVQGEVDCFATLTYTANLVMPGDVRFQYQYTDKDTLLHFQVKNSECETSHDHRNNKYPAVTEEGEWKYVAVSLKSGINVLTWIVFAVDKPQGQGLRKPVMVKNIELMGIAYTSQCMKCPSGTQSGDGAEECTECEAGSFSNKGAGQCTACNPDTEYSETGASKCITRPQCSVNDYYALNSPCDKNMTQVKYDWIQPKVCVGGVSLPQAEAPQPCPPCNPGMELWNSTCRFCQANHYSDGSARCAPCPGSTAPETSIQYRWWNNLPDDANLSAYCLSLTDRGCASKAGWQPSVDYMHSGRGHADDVYLVLSLSISGFRGKEQLVNGQSVPVAEITFEFATECSSPECAFIFMQQTSKSGTTPIKTWEASQLKQAYSHPIISTESVTFIWAFQKKDIADYEEGAEGSFLMKDDHALLYAINVTNTVEGGATSCKACPKGLSQEGCIPCAPGEFVAPGSQQCTRCPENQIVRGLGGQEGCVACGTGLTTSDHVRCETECKLLSDGKEYDFTSLSAVQSVMGPRLFTSGGTQYYHVFNISLCGGNRHYPLVHCADNITFPGEEGKKDVSPQVESAICRSTIIPPIPGDEKTMSAQPVSLADTLVNITTNGSSLDMAERMESEGFQHGEDDLDVHFVYASDVPTDACSKGRTTIITLRCDPTQGGNGSIVLPPRCSDGTCDGCSFHLLWYSRAACPTCKRQDYQEVKGECVDGKQKITSIPPKHCILLEDSKAIDREQECSVLWPTWLTVVVSVVPVLVVLVIIFIFIAIYCCMRNRNLEYKYMKLVTSSNNKEGNYDELPAAETCALEDGEEEEQYDAVQFTESRGNKFFNKLKGRGAKKGALLDNLKSVPLTMGFQKAKKYGVIDPEMEELFSEEEAFNMET